MDSIERSIDRPRDVPVAAFALYRSRMRGGTAMYKKALAIVCGLGVTFGVANAAVTVNESNDILVSVFVPCAAGGAGEIVDLNGPLHTLVTFTINGNNVSGKFHFQPQGISGVGENTGDKYQATGVTQQTFKASLQNGQTNLTFVNNF